MQASRDNRAAETVARCVNLSLGSATGRKRKTTGNHRDLMAAGGYGSDRVRRLPSFVRGVLAITRCSGFQAEPETFVDSR